MPKISGGSVAEHRMQVQQRVFDALVELMTEGSFEAVTMAGLAARAGLGRTAIYHHFPDKEAVVVAFASHETSSYLAALEDVLADADTPPSALRTYVRHHLAAGEQFHAGLGPQVHRVLTAQARLAMREHVVVVEQVLRDILARGVQTGDFVVEDPDATVRLVHLSLAARDLPADAVEEFVLRAVGSGNR